MFVREAGRFFSNDAKKEVMKKRWIKERANGGINKVKKVVNKKERI